MDALTRKVQEVFDEPACGKNQAKGEKERKKGCTKYGFRYRFHLKNSPVSKINFSTVHPPDILRICILSSFHGASHRARHP